MSTLDPAFQAHLDTGSTTLAWAWRITRQDGMVYGFTDHDRDLTFLSTTFESETGLIPSEIRAGSDLAVDAQDAMGALTSAKINETDIADGLWDNATVEVYRVNWADTSQRSLRRKGSIGQVRRGRASFVAEVRSLTHLLGQTIGRTFQASCDAAVGDSRCKANLELSTFKASGCSVSSVSDPRTFACSGIGAFADGWFVAGLLTWTGGLNAGRVAEVAIHSGSTLVMLDIPILAIQPGDTFDVRAGCDKSAATCAAKFANTTNFRGFPTIPPQESVLTYASVGGTNSGQPL